jgi:hypothetical protein
MMLSPIPTQRFGLAEILDETFSVLRQALIPILTLSLLTLLPLATIELILVLLNDNGDASSSPMPALFSLEFFTGIFAERSRGPVAWLSALILVPLLTGAIIYATTQFYATNVISIGDSYRVAGRRLPALIGAQILTILVIIGVLLPALLCLVVSQSMLLSHRLDAILNPNTATTGTTFIYALIALSVLLGLLALPVVIRLSFVTQAVILEQRSPVDSISRSWDLTERKFWRVLLFTTILSLLTLVAFELPLRALVQFSMPFMHDSWIRHSMNTVATVLTDALATSFNVIAYTIMYFILRREFEQQNVVE